MPDLKKAVIAALAVFAAFVALAIAGGAVMMIAGF